MSVGMEGATAVETRVALVGGGLIGSSWAAIFARAGCRVRIYDVSQAQRASLSDAVAELLRELEAAGLAEDAAGAATRVSVCDDLSEAVAGADHVQENGPERLEVKRALLAEIDAAAPEAATVASSTSALLPSTLSEQLAGRARFLIAHPVNPPHLVPVVELCPAPWTRPAAVERVRALMVRIGQQPLVMEREIDGFILNRLQGALLREAFRLVDAGVARVEDVDAAVAHGLGLRWSFMGPFETIDLNAPDGIADYGRRYRDMYAKMAAQNGEPEAAPWSDALLAKAEAQRRALLPADRLAVRQRWRDRRLQALAQHKRAQGTAEGE